MTGIVLYAPAFRGPLAPIRIPLKNIHITLGIISIFIIVSYIPYLGRHWQSLKKAQNRQSTIVVALTLLCGWVISGALLWLERSIPPSWAFSALIVHDLLTWMGVPWIIGHAIISSRRRNERRQHTRTPVPIINENVREEGFLNRRSFLRTALIAATVTGLGAPMYRMLKRITDFGGSDLGEYVIKDGNKMIPSPIPAPESLAITGGGIQGQFRVYTVTDIPQFTSETWNFTVKGLVYRPIHLNWEQFLRLKRSVQVSDFHCVTGWSVTSITWEGVPLKELLDYVGVKPNGKFVKFYSGDKVYTDALSLQQACLNDVMVAVLMDGKPIPQQLGGPVRLIVPKMYAYKSIKWLETIEVIEKPYIGYWENLGYTNDAWV